MKKTDEFSAGPDTQCMVYYGIFTYILHVHLYGKCRSIYPYNIECLGGMDLKQVHIGVNKSIRCFFCIFPRRLANFGRFCEQRDLGYSFWMS